MIILLLFFCYTLLGVVSMLIDNLLMMLLYVILHV